MMSDFFFEGGGDIFDPPVIFDFYLLMSDFFGHHLRNTGKILLLRLCPFVAAEVKGG